MSIPTAKRFRAYTAAEGRNRRAAEGEEGATWPIEEVAFEGKVRDGKAEFDAGKTVITKVVFYAGDPEVESVVDSFEVNASGKIAVGG